MYAGHFATALLFHSYFPAVNPFLFTFGVGILDIIFAILAYFNIEKLTINPHAGLLGVDLHCPFSHSLVGSLIISLLWGTIGLNSHVFLPVFFSAFSHFLEDWLVHNLDIELYPKSKIYIGGTSLWSRYPYGSYYLELLICLCCSIILFKKRMTNIMFSIQDICRSLAIGYIFYLHYQRRPAVSGKLAEMIRKTSEKKEGSVVFAAFMKSFVTPAIIVGFLLYISK